MTDLIAWFLDRAKAELPSRIHSRDTAENGNPEWHRGFESYITDGENGHYAAHHRDDQEYCNHPTLTEKEGGVCPTCDGSDLRVRTRRLLKHPMKAALGRLSRHPVPSGRPRLDSVLWALLVADGDLGLISAALSPKYACMGSPAFVRTWTMTALIKLRGVYREDVPAKEIRKSESQSIAEAA